MIEESAAPGWERALVAAAVLAINPAAVGGVRLRAQAGPVRDIWLAALRAFAGNTPIVKMPASIDDGRLLGGLDFSATLATGRPVVARGLLAGADGGIVIAAMAERLSGATASLLTAAIDRGAIYAERDGLSIFETARFGIVALDEGVDDEALAPALADRLAIHIDIEGIAARDATPPTAEFIRAVTAARARFAAVENDDEAVSALCRAATALGIESLRPALGAVVVARAIAALGGRCVIGADDAREAAALVLAPRATQTPAAPDEESSPDEENAPNEDSEPETEPQRDATAPMDDVVLEAAAAAIPPNLLARLTAGNAAMRARSRGKSGAKASDMQHGRRVGSRAGTLRSGVRLDLVATLRAAAPFQKMRAAGADRIAIRLDDLRIVRFEQRARTVTIFLVDASGSAARERLAEAKGAVRLMLADCYIRRDEVALIAFRRDGAELLLPPTRSLVRAERALAALPGGGGTPLAAGLDAATQLARTEALRSRTPTLILMSDGRANVARDGAGGRPRAHEEALDAAKGWRVANHAAAFIDTSASPNPLASAIAVAMGARYVPLPNADARDVNAAVRAIGRRA